MCSVCLVCRISFEQIQTGSGRKKRTAAQTAVMSLFMKDLLGKNEAVRNRTVFCFCCSGDEPRCGYGHIIKLQEMAGGNNIMAKELKDFRYSPGYCDMRGASHREVMKPDEKGVWTITSRDKEIWSDPMTVTVYEVSEEDLKSFETFLREKNIPSLANRLKSPDFLTDYSPWEIELTMFDSSALLEKEKEYVIRQYRIYTKKDQELIEELKQRFKDLHGKKISERKETND